MRKRQAGWSLLESAVVVALVGLMTVAFWQTLTLVESKQRAEATRDTLQRAEDALYGMALRDHRLPMPEDAVPSAGGADHWEGWLPADVLGTAAPRSIRYVVDRSLAQAPPAIYRADPLGLLGDAVAARTAVNGLDLCMQVVLREERTHAVGQGARLAWSVHQGEAGAGLDARAHGYLEFVTRLGCAPALAALATEVKAAVLASDLRELALLDVSLRSLAVQDAEDSVRNHQWRLANVMARLAVSSWNLVATKLTGATTPMAAFSMATNIAGFTFEAARWATFIDYSIQRAARARATVEAAQGVLASAREQLERRDAQRAAHLRRVDALQFKGLMP